MLIKKKACIFQAFSALSERFIDIFSIHSSTKSNLTDSPFKNIFSVLWLKKLYPLQLMCVTSQFLSWNIDKHLPEAVFEYSWKSLELHQIWNSATSFFHKVFPHIVNSCFWDGLSRFLLIDISNGSWQHYFVIRYDDSWLMYKLHFTEERFPSKMFQILCARSFPRPSPLTGKCS